MKHNELKAAAEAAQAAYTNEQSRLIAAGFKSSERYNMLKDLKAAADAAHDVYAKAAKSYVRRELDKIIAAQTPAQRAEGLRRARGI